jgi:hypothetical protein
MHLDEGIKYLSLTGFRPAVDCQPPSPRDVRRKMPSV